LLLLPSAPRWQQKAALLETAIAFAAICLMFASWWRYG
jgi:hypothetical protein